MVCDLCVLTPELRTVGSVFGPALHGILLGSPVAVVLATEKMEAAVKP